MIYEPQLLRSMQEICTAFGVGQKTIRAWIQQGAPIAVEGQGRRARYSTELTRLQCWREQTFSCGGGGTPQPSQPGPAGLDAGGGAATAPCCVPPGGCV